jgi:hypothetical protein
VRGLIDIARRQSSRPLVDHLDVGWVGVAGDFRGRLGLWRSSDRHLAVDAAGREGQCQDERECRDEGT